ncbi:MAG: peptide chain release factor N(5)-glutamine methyltransferase [Polyangia bacterium]
MRLERWTTGKVLDWATRDFRSRRIESPRLEADLLLAHVLGCRRLDLYTDRDRPLRSDELAAYREAIRRRRDGEPVAHLTGRREFWSLDLEVTPEVLVPRPETETLVEALLGFEPQGPFLDLGTGSGCVALALAGERSDVRVDAADVSAAALRVARSNAERLGLGDRVRFFEGDLFDPLPAGERYGAIASNPPYVPSGRLSSLPAEVRREPELALDGGEDGLDLVRRVLRDAGPRLAPGGVLVVEIDPDQARSVAGEIGPRLLGREGEVFEDLARRERVVAFRTTGG